MSDLTSARAVLASVVSISVLSGCPGERARVDEPRPTRSPSPPAFERYERAPRPALELWRRFGNAHQFEIGLYQGVVPMARHAEEVVYGKVAAIRLRHEPGVVAWIRSVEVRLRNPDSFTLGPLGEADGAIVSIGAVSGPNPHFQQKFENMLGDEALFFVNRAGAPQPEFDIPAVPEAERRNLYFPISPQGVLLNDRGTVRWALEFGDRGFPLRLDGTPFHELVAKAAAAVGDGG